MMSKLTGCQSNDTVFGDQTKDILHLAWIPVIKGHSAALGEMQDIQFVKHIIS